MKAPTGPGRTPRHSLHARELKTVVTAEATRWGYAEHVGTGGTLGTVTALAMGATAVLVVSATTMLVRSRSEMVPEDVTDPHGDVCDGPRVERADVRRRTAPRDASESWSRLVALQRHCPLARRLRDLGAAAVRARQHTPLLRSSNRMGPCMLVGGDFLRAVDDGEFGGSIDVLSEDASERRIFDDNVSALAATSAGLVGVGGLSHLGLQRTNLIALDVGDGPPHVTSIACFPVAPIAAEVASDGTLLVALGWPSDLPRPDHWEKTIALDDDGTFYDLGCDPGRLGARLDVTWQTDLKDCPATFPLRL